MSITRTFKIRCRSLYGLTVALLFSMMMYLPLRSQSISSNKLFNIYLHNDFNKNNTGIYWDNEWQSDWNFPVWSNRQVPPEIMEDTIFFPKRNHFMRWHFPRGSVGPEQGGGQWFTKFGELQEVYLSYNIRFKPGFDWVISGKLPGLRGGPRWSGAGPPSRKDGFVALLMWNKEGILKFYYYHHNQTHEYGDMKSWNHTIETGKWFNITIRVVINTLNKESGNPDGIMEGFINGRLVSQVTGLKLRDISCIHVDQIFMTSSFGGVGNQFAAKNNEWIDIDDVIVYDYTDSIRVVKGNIPNPKGATIVLPYPAPLE